MYLFIYSIDCHLPIIHTLDSNHRTCNMYTYTRMCQTFLLTYVFTSAKQVMPTQRFVLHFCYVDVSC
jgi:hypothetical protein